jgi:RNA polymerase sigma factor (TIGR02999 family)
LRAESDGDVNARRLLLERFYGDIRRLARTRRARASLAPEEQPTDAANSLVAKLLKGSQPLSANDRDHFRLILRTALFNMLIDRRRERIAKKRGGDVEIVPLSTDAPISSAEAIRVEHVLQELSERDPRQYAVIECTALAGWTIAETAVILGIGVTTVKTDLHRARNWLRQNLAVQT